MQLINRRFFYAQLNLTPKGGGPSPQPRKREVVVEVPKDLAQLKESEIIDWNVRKVIAADVARQVAIGTFPAVEC
jgi:hypothetical protein